MEDVSFDFNGFVNGIKEIVSYQKNKRGIYTIYEYLYYNCKRDLNMVL